MLATPIRGTFLESGTEISYQSDPHNEIEFFEAVLPQQTGIFSRSNRIIAVSRTQVAEISPHPFSTQKKGTVLEVHDLRGLDRLKFKKGCAGILTLQFKNDKLMRFAMTSPDACVDCIKERMKVIGLEGETKTNPIDIKKITTAEAFLEATREIEAQFALRPSFQLVMQMMDLLREAAEQFAEAGDARYEIVTQTTQNFLQREDVMRIIDDNGKERRRQQEEKEREIERQRKHGGETKSNTAVSVNKMERDVPPPQPQTPLRKDRSGLEEHVASPRSVDSEEAGWVCEQREHKEHDMYHYFPVQEDIIETTGLQEMGLGNSSMLNTTPPTSATKSEVSNDDSSMFVCEEEVEAETAKIHEALAQDHVDFADTNPMLAFRNGSGKSWKSEKSVKSEKSGKLEWSGKSASSQKTPRSATSLSPSIVPQSPASPAVSSFLLSSIETPFANGSPSLAKGSFVDDDDVALLGDEFAFLVEPGDRSTTDRSHHHEASAERKGNEKGADAVDELSDMLGDITQEFHSMMATISKVDDEDDDIFGERAATTNSH